MTRFLFFSLFIFTACVHRSNDPILDVESNWASGEYILEQEGNSESLAILKAKEWIARGDYRAAMQELNADNLQYVVDAELSFLKGKVQYELGNLPTAGRLLEDANQLGYTNGELYELLVRVYLELNREEEATDLSKTLTEQQPTAENMSLRAQVLLATGDTTEAKQYFTRSMKADSALRMNYLGLERILSAGGDFDEAIAVGSTSVRRFPADHEILEVYAQVLEDAGQYRAAIRTTAKLLETQPEDPGLLAWRAKLYLKNRHYDSAVYAASASLVFREDAGTKMLLATAMERQRFYTNALEVYREVYAADSTNADAEAAVRRLEGRQRYLQYLRQQRDSTQQQTPDSAGSNSN